jgi:hypothetical protein
LLVPHPLEQILGTQEGGRVKEQRLQHPELLDRQIEQAPIAAHGSPQRVKLDPCGAQDPASCGGAPPGQRADAQHQLREVERLAEIIVRTKAQT